MAVAWSSAGRTSAPTPYFRLWTIGLDGGLPKRCRCRALSAAVYSPDGSRIAHEEFSTAFIPRGTRPVTGGTTAAAARIQSGS